MNLAIQSTTARTWHTMKLHRLGAAFGLALALVLVGVAAWQATSATTDHGAAVAAALPVAPAAPANSTPSYFIVSPRPDASTLKVISDYAGFSAPVGGLPSHDVQVVVAADDATVAQMLQDIDQANNIRYMSGLGPINVIDLRAP